MDSKSYIPTSQCDDITLCRIAQCVYDLDVEFYSLLTGNSESVIAKIVRSLKDPGSDLGSGYVALDSSTPVGYVAYFPYQQKMTRNLASLRAMLDFSDPSSRDIAKGMTQFHSLLAPIGVPCYYLNKIIVFKEHAGKYFGKNIFHHYLQQSSAANLPPMFHVKSDNKDAMHFYSKYGFHTEQSGFKYLLCKNKSI